MKFPVMATTMYLCLGRVSAGDYGYRLSASEYALMPPINHLEPYEPCLESGGQYCMVKGDLVTDRHSDLYTMIRRYSSNAIMHYNHTRIKYGICVTDTCKNYIKGNLTDLKSSLEACLNESMWNKYQLKVRVSNDLSCDTAQRVMEIRTIDVTVAVICLTIFLLNVVGSVYEFYYPSDDNKQDNFIKCFSIPLNWKRLLAPPEKSSDPRQMLMKSFYGIKCTVTYFVVLFHGLIVYWAHTENTRLHEQVYRNPFFMTLVNGMMGTQATFVLSAFLIAFKLQIYAEKQPITWSFVSKTMFLRYLRFIPTYALVILITITWERFLSSGPLWQDVVMFEVDNCQHSWWRNVLFVDNYVSGYCLPHAWYLATDMQMFLLGLLVFMLKDAKRKAALALLFIAGLILPAAHVYFQELDGSLIITPESARSLFTENKMFGLFHLPGHNNIAGFVLGLATGQLAYHLLSTDFKFRDFIKHPVVYWLVTVPGAFGVVALGNQLYPDGDRAAQHWHILYAALSKPAFSVCICILAVGTIYQYESVYRGFFEWDVWASLSRLSYSTYIGHFLNIRIIFGSKTSLNSFSFLHILDSMTSVIVMSYLVGLVLWIFVEAPFDRLVKLYLTPKRAEAAISGTQERKVK